MKTHEDYIFWVYILSNRSHTLYIGVTNNLRNRITDHRKLIPGTFTARYKITRLVYCEQFQYINNAIAREKELKHWTRAQKIALIEAANPTWEELMPDEPVTTPPPSNADSLRESQTKEPLQHFTFVIPEGNLRLPLLLHLLLLYLVCHPAGICICLCRCS